MDRKVTPQEIEALYAFTRRHFVEYYDLQTELTDHLANAIEETWQQQPALTFEEALKKEFKKFGIYGFSDVVEKRQKALHKKYLKLCWGYFKQFFTLPLLLLTVSSVYIVYIIFMFKPLIWVVIAIFIYVFNIIKRRKLKKIYNAKVQKTGRRWLLEESMFTCSLVGSGAGLFTQSVQFGIQENWNPVIGIIFSVILVLSTLYNYVVLYIIPSRAEEHLKAAYPEYNLEILE